MMCILTAIRIDQLRRLLLSRVVIIRCARPAPEHLDAVFRGILQKRARGLRVDPSNLPELEPVTADLLRKAFDVAADVRRRKRAVETALGAVAASPRRLD